MTNNINPHNEKFFTESKIQLEIINHLPTRHSIKGKIVSFLKHFKAVIGPMGVEVYDGDKIIGAIGRMNNLHVHIDYRGRGIAEEMIFQWLINNPNFRAPNGAIRSPGGARAYSKAWTRYKETLKK